MVSGRTRWPWFSPKPNYYFLAHLQCSLNLHSNLFGGICKVYKLTSKKYAKTFDFLCPGNKDFVKYQAQERGFNPKHPLRTPLPFETVFNREKNKWTTKVFVLLKQKKLDQIKEPLTNMDVIIWTRLMDFKSPFLVEDLKPYR